MNDMIAFFAAEYNEENWKAFADCAAEADVRIEGIEQDIVNTVIGVLGREAGHNWLHTPLTQFDRKTAIELAQTAAGKKALKAFIMRLPC